MLRLPTLAVTVLLLVGCGAGSTASGPEKVLPASVRTGVGRQERRVRCAYVRVTGGGGRRFAAGGYEVGSAAREKSRTEGIFVARVDDEGDPVWRHDLACSGGASVMSVHAGLDGSCWVAGWFSGSLALADTRSAPQLEASGLGEMYLLAYAPSGRFLWAATTSTAGEHPYCTGDLITGMADGSCVVVGNVSGKTVFGTGESNEPAIEALSRERAFVARYSARGELMWVRALPGSVDIERGAALSVSRRGEVVVSGSLFHKQDSGQRGARKPKALGQSNRGLFTASYNSEGALQWTREASGCGAIAANGAAVTRDGSRLITGWFMGAIWFEDADRQREIRASGLMGLFVACYGPAGELRWIRTAGGEGEAFAEGQHIEERMDGSLEVRGIFGGTVRLGERSRVSEPLAAKRVADALVARFDAEGRVLALTRRAIHR